MSALSVLALQHDRPLIGLALKSEPGSYLVEDEVGANTLAGVAIRLIGLRDRNYAARMHWLDGWLPDCDTRWYDGEDTQLLSQVQSRFDVLILHGDDPGRMARIIKGWRSVLSSKLIVAITSEPDGRAQTSFLNAGADAAFDLETPAPVATAWLGALVARTAERRKVERPVNEVIDNLCLEVEATRLQRKVIDLLAHQDGQTVPYAALLEGIGKADNQQNIRSLHVAICILKKKLPANVRIANMHGVGYKLSFAQ